MADKDFITINVSYPGGTHINITIPFVEPDPASSSESEPETQPQPQPQSTLPSTTPAPSQNRRPARRQRLHHQAHLTCAPKHPTAKMSVSSNF